MEPIESAARSEIRMLQAKRFVEQCERAWKDVPFYRNRWEHAGLRMDDIKSIEDLHRLPIISRADFDADLKNNPPFGTYQGSAPPARVHASSGITGEPRPIFCSRQDCRRISELSARRL